ncbi:methyltransferase domain-containing protein [Nakamurella sp.]|uniref:class I SAM-dependent methyltransferase n=1 Tax=Nakamurella sp. TaxID=1869182 RepID=UPI003784291B
MTTSTAAGPDLVALKTGQHQTWSSGNYGRIAWITEPLADELVAAVDLVPGRTVLDVATGTGHVAIAAARGFCPTTGIDYVAGLVDTAARRAAAEGLDITFEVGDAEALPYADGRFDYVLSAIGTMFTANHQQTADEMVRVCRPGGRIGMANWTPSGFVGRMLQTVGRHVAPPAGALPPTRWGDPRVVAELFGGQVDDLRTWTTAVRQRFLGAEHFADFFLANYGPTLKAAGKLNDAGRAAFRADLVALAEEFNLATDGTFVSEWEYLLVSARKR